MVDDLLGRYELNSRCATFRRISDNAIKHTWGIAGFMPNEDTLSDEYALMTIKHLIGLGYIKTDSAPISEGDNMIGESIFDWLNGVQR